MITMTLVPSPVGLDVQVDIQLTLTYKISELKELAHNFRLGSTLAQAASDEIQKGMHEDGNDPYPALAAL